MVEEMFRGWFRINGTTEDNDKLVFFRTLVGFDYFTLLENCFLQGCFMEGWNDLLKTANAPVCSTI